MMLLANYQTTRSMAHSRGFTLIELMIVVAIVGILAGVAYPAYQEYGRRAKRSEGRAHLLDAAARMERFYSDNNQYTTDLTNGANGANIATSTENGHYSLAVTVSNNNQQFTLTATPSGWTDAKCGALTYTNQGVKGEGGDSTVDECWSR